MEATIPISFPFPLPDNDTLADLIERVTFWDSPSTQEWFRQRGYTLYVHSYLSEENLYDSEPVLDRQTSCDMRYPYPHFGKERTAKPSLRASDSTGKVAYAQETQDPSHHVAIKLIVTDSEEHRILKFLQSQEMGVLRANCLIPVLAILPNGPFSFVVMPRWGGVVYLPKGGPIRNVFRIMHSLLKAVAFLHENNILHRDIKLDNVLVNHFSNGATNYHNSWARRELRSSNELNYCLFDFDISMMLPPDTDRTQCRLPYRLSWDGTGFQPYDTWQGEFDYNPFAFDVGTLGVVFCENYLHLTPQIPMLAPFLDRMVTRNIPFRFTAAEALQFFERFLPEIPEEVMNLEFSENTEVVRYECDKWKGLSPGFVKKWETFREPPVPYSTSLLRRIYVCERLRMPYVLPVVRFFIFRITLIPSRIRLFLCKLWNVILR